MKLLVSMLLAYILGCVNPACRLAEIRGFDIRERGTGNPGATNALMSMGLGSGILVVLLDMGKAMLSILLASQLCRKAVWAKIMAGVCCTLGHVFPATMGFKGGRGTACLAGTILYLTPGLFLPMAAGAFLIGVLFDRASLLPPLVTLVYPVLYELTVGNVRETLLLCLFIPLIGWTHRKNLSRYREGKEIGVRKFFFGGKKNKEKDHSETGVVFLMPRIEARQRSGRRALWCSPDGSRGWFRFSRWCAW